MAPSRSSPSSLSTLPPELLVQVFLACLWRDILALRQTSKLLYLVTKEREIWIQQVSYFTIAPSSSATPLYYIDRPLNFYTATELESVVFRWMKSAKGWIKESPTPCREILLKIDEQAMPQDPHCLRLTPGGRWLLMFDQYTGGIFSYDLDSSNPTSTRTPLVPPRFEDGFEQFCISNVDVNAGMSVLTFHICILYCLEFETTRWTTEIWRFKTVSEKNNGAKTYLSAELVVSFFFMRMPEGFMSSPALNGSTVLFELSESDVDEPRTAVILVDWSEVADGSHNFERRSLLTSERYLLASPHFLLVQDIGNGLNVVNMRGFHAHRDNVGFSEFHHLHDYSATCLVSRIADCPLGPNHIHPSISVDGTSNVARMLISLEDGKIVLVEFPLGGDDCISACTRILEFEGSEIGHHVDLIGRQHTFSACGAHVHLATIIWPEDSMSAPTWIAVQRPIAKSYASALAMDEGTGRILLYHAGGASVSVMDVSA